MKNPAAVLSLLFALFVPVVVANCSSGVGQSAADRPAYADTAAATADSATAEPGQRAASSDASTADYHLATHHPRSVGFQVPDLNKTIQVSDDGNVSLPLIGKRPSSAASRRARLREIIGDKLRKKDLQSPQVNVFVKQYGQRVTVSGEVKTPRVMSLEGSLTLSQSVASAGGLTELADPKRIHVARAHMKGASTTRSTISKQFTPDN